MKFVLTLLCLSASILFAQDKADDPIILLDPAGEGKRWVVVEFYRGGQLRGMPVVVDKAWWDDLSVGEISGLLTAAGGLVSVFSLYFGNRHGRKK